MRLRRYHGPTEDVGIPVGDLEAGAIEAIIVLAARGLQPMTEAVDAFRMREAARNARRRAKVGAP